MDGDDGLEAGYRIRREQHLFVFDVTGGGVPYGLKYTQCVLLPGARREEKPP